MQIHIPTPLRVYTGQQATVAIEAGTVQQALQGLTEQHPELRRHMYAEDGKLRAFVNVYLNDEDVRYLPAREETAVGAGDELSIIPSIAGGAGWDWRLSIAGDVPRGTFAKQKQDARNMEWQR